VQRRLQDIVVPDSYPFQPVKMKFITKVYHPNVSSTSGAISLDILKDAWSPTLTLKNDAHLPPVPPLQPIARMTHRMPRLRSIT
jgi:hypothetical protein